MSHMIWHTLVRILIWSNHRNVCWSSCSGRWVSSGCGRRTFSRCPRSFGYVRLRASTFPLTSSWFCLPARWSRAYNISTNIWIWLPIVIRSDIFAQIKLRICHLEQRRSNGKIDKDDNESEYRYRQENAYMWANITHKYTAYSN